MKEIFYWILNMSINALICAIPVLLIRAFKIIPRRYTVFLWTVPFLRMALPISFSSDFSLMKIISRFTSKTVFINVGKLDYSVMNHVMKAESYFPIKYKNESLEKTFSVFGNIWIVVSLFLIFAVAFVYFSTMKEMRRALRLKDNVYISDAVKIPAVYGIFCPKIIVPSDYDEKSLNYILLHENSHIKYFDNLFRLIALFLGCIHWFNPFCILFLKLFYSDMELACDERVMKRFGEKEKKEYANSLIHFAEQTVVIASPFGGAKIKTRIKNIISFKKITFFSSICFTALIALTIYFLIANA